MSCASKGSLLVAFAYMICSKFACCRVPTDSMFNIDLVCLSKIVQLSRSNAGLCGLGSLHFLTIFQTVQHKRALLLWTQPFWKRYQDLQLVSSTCHSLCVMLCCCKLDRVPCIIMSLYPKSAAKLLEDHAGQPDSLLALCLGLCA